MNSVGGAGEQALLERIKPYLAAQSGQDDAAVLPDADGFVVASCDMFVERIHFDLDWMSPQDAGWRSLALALGDLAAKGAKPAWVLTSLAMPKGWAVDNLTGLYEGMAALALKTRLMIVGGDMSSIEGPAVLSITVVGHTDIEPLPRSKAKEGWSVAVTGPLGASALALREHRALRLVPRLEEGRRLNRIGLCCGDISDGLLREMEKFAAMANVGCMLHVDQVPIADRATPEDALTSGEEAELVCAGPIDIIREAGLRPVGILTHDVAVKAVDGAGKPFQMKRLGYDHFA